MGSFLAEGVRLVEELLDSDARVEFILTGPSLASTSRGERLLEKIQQAESPHEALSDAELKRLAATDSPQGVLAVAHKKVSGLADFRPGEESAILVLDRISDPGNLGTLLRVAHALGAAWVVALPGTVDPWNPKAVRASAGSLFGIPISQEPWPEVLLWLRAQDFTIFCADPSGQTMPRSSAPVARFALIVGSEATGLSDDVRAACDHSVAVELAAGVESLNAAVAGALLLDRLLSN